MSQYGWDDCPEEAQGQVARMLEGFRAHLGDNLLGVYLHGSLAMGCFNPARSDLDILVVTPHAILLETKRALAELLLTLSRRPHPVEISFLHQDDLIPWSYPTPFDFHFSEDWREEFERALATGTWRTWDEKPRRDADLAAHITILRHRGVRLYGAAIADVFPIVPPEDYADSIQGDIEAGLDDLPNHPVYGILNACRTLAYRREGHILSKDEGGQWATQTLPSPLQTVAAKALAAYRGEMQTEPFAPEELTIFAAQIRQTFYQPAPPSASTHDRQ